MSDISSSWTSHLSEVPTHCLEAEVERRRVADLPPAPEPDPAKPAYRVTLDVLSLNLIRRLGSKERDEAAVAREEFAAYIAPIIDAWATHAVAAAQSPVRA